MLSGMKCLQLKAYLPQKGADEAKSDQLQICNIVEELEITIAEADAHKCLNTP